MKRFAKRMNLNGENNPLNKILFNSRTALMAYNAQMYKD